jgi:hypothetical protein
MAIVGHPVTASVSAQAITTRQAVSISGKSVVGTAESIVDAIAVTLPGSLTINERTVNATADTFATVIAGSLAVIGKPIIARTVTPGQEFGSVQRTRIMPSVSRVPIAAVTASRTAQVMPVSAERTTLGMPVTATRNQQDMPLIATRTQEDYT